MLAAVGSAHACLEVVDSVLTDYRFRIEDNTADGSSAAGVVLGAEIPLEAIVEVEVTLLVDGEPSGTGAAAMPAVIRPTAWCGWSEQLASVASGSGPATW